ncbi:hypothetical protein ACP4OV_028062 [Aristida adscensionis]
MKQTSGFVARDDEEAEAAERIGREITRNCCGGLPLVAKALGRTLRSVENPQHWSAVLGEEDSQGIWNTANRLHTLEVFSHLKQGNHMTPLECLCFASCALFFPKGRSISSYDLNWQWRTHGMHLFDASSCLVDRSLLLKNSASEC